MTPKRRDRFFSSLRQLEQRLASESSPIKKGRLEECKELAGTEPTLANASSATKCGFAAVANTTTNNDETVGAAHNFRSADANADLKGSLADANDASNFGLAASNATLRCLLAYANATSICKAAHVPDLWSCVANVGQPGISLSPGSGLAGAESVEAATKMVHAGHYLESAGVGSTGTDAVNNNDTSAGAAKAICPRLDTSSGDRVHVVNVDYLSHGREPSDSITLCEEEEEIYDAIFSGDNNEDSGSLLELSAHWNPWEIGRHTCESDSHPPAEFLSIPMTNDIKDVVDGKTPEFPEKSLCQDLHEQEENDLQDLTCLCALLGLGERAWLPAEGKEASPARQMNKLFDESRLDSDALYREHPSSTFYSNVAKVGSGENSSECAKALDFQLQRLWQLHTEPYCCALLLLAKASLQRKKDMAEGLSGEFPSIVQEWLALQRVADEQKLM